MTPATGDALPKYFKDSDGYCYGATPLLAGQTHLTPWDGAINAAGYAVEVSPEAPVVAKPSVARTPKRSKPWPC